LAYHKEGTHAIAFAYNIGSSREEGETDHVDGEELEIRSRWLATGGKDGRIAVWQLMDFLK
jgi:ASTRA-associated protein 1